MSAGIEVVVTDLETGDRDEKVIQDDYILITAGRRYLDGIAKYGNGTVVLTIKVQVDDA